MFKELLPFLRERGVKGLGERKLPDNSDSFELPETHRGLSATAKSLWDRRKYGTFVASIYQDKEIKLAICQLGQNESRLLEIYLICRLAAEDRTAIGNLPKDHPDRNGLAEIYWREKVQEAEIFETMIDDLAKNTEEDSAIQAVGLISQELQAAAEDAKRNFFRPVTREVSETDRDELIASQLRLRAQRIDRIKAQALAKKG